MESSGLRRMTLSRAREPSFKGHSFTCPRCGVFAAQHWIDLFNRTITMKSGLANTVWKQLDDLAFSQCSQCHGRCLWFEQRLLFPTTSTFEAAPADMPTSLARDYEEAREIASASPRAAAALLRMCVERLCREVAGKTKFDDAISELEARGMPDEIAMAMDVVRTNGNEVLHAGQLYGEDDQKTVGLLFNLVRLIVTWAITERRQLRELYGQIPEEKRKHIEARRTANKEKSGAGASS